MVVRASCPDRRSSSWCGLQGCAGIDQAVCRDSVEARGSSAA